MSRYVFLNYGGRWASRVRFTLVLTLVLWLGVMMITCFLPDPPWVIKLWKYVIIVFIPGGGE